MKLAIIGGVGIVTLGISVYGIHESKRLNVDNKTKIEQLTTQPQVKYKRKSASKNETQSIVKENFKTGDGWLKTINANKDCFVLITSDDNSFYQNTEGIPDKKTMNKIVSSLKKTGKPLYAISPNEVNAVMQQIKNQQEKQQVQAVSPFMLIYFNSENGKTTSTNLLSSVDSSRTIVAKNTQEWINRVIK